LILPQSDRKLLYDLLSFLGWHAPEVEIMQRLAGHLRHDREREVSAWKQSVGALGGLLEVDQVRRIGTIGIVEDLQGFEFG